MHNRILFFATVFLLGCSGSEGPSKTPGESLVFGASELFQPENYPNFSSVENIEGTYMMFVKANYAFDDTYSEQTIAVQDQFRAVVSIIQDDNQNYWLIQPYLGDVGLVYPFTLNTEVSPVSISTRLQLYGGNASLLATQNSAGEISGQIEASTPSEYPAFNVDTSEVVFKKMSDQPTLAGVWQDNQTALGTASWYWSYQTAEQKYAAEPLPAHLFAHGHRALTFSENGITTDEKSSEYFMVGNIQRNLADTIDAQSSYTDGVGYTASAPLSPKSEITLNSRVFTINATIEMFYAKEPYDINMEKLGLTFTNYFSGLAINPDNPEDEGNSEFWIDLNIAFAFD